MTENTTPNASTCELLMLLNNLKTIHMAIAQCATRHASEHLYAALECEAHVLRLKLEAMHARWQTFLPLKENMGVDFSQWAEEVEAWTADGLPSHASLSTGFMLDLMGEPVCQLQDDLQREVTSYCSRIDRRLSEPVPQDWEQQIFTDEPNLGPMRQRAMDELKRLRDELYGLEEFFYSELNEQQFLVLALRLLHRDCRKVEKQAHDEVMKARNQWPQRYIRERARKMKDDLKLSLLSDETLKELPDYIDLDDPSAYRNPSFGKFLFRCRHTLHKDKLQSIVRTLEMIHLLNEVADPTGSARKRAKEAQGRDLSDEEKQIYRTLVRLASRAEWRNGATTESITDGLDRMLGVGYTLDTPTTQLSDCLWRLLKDRKNCDAEKSLQVTWLNIVGWCVKQRLLAGGSPALCHQFFPKAGDDDYKAIDKGKNNPAQSFVKIIPLLERFLK